MADAAAGLWESRSHRYGQTSAEERHQLLQISSSRGLQDVHNLTLMRDGIVQYNHSPLVQVLYIALHPSNGEAEARVYLPEHSLHCLRGFPRFPTNLKISLSTARAPRGTICLRLSTRVKGIQKLSLSTLSSVPASETARSYACPRSVRMLNST